MSPSDVPLRPSEVPQALTAEEIAALEEAIGEAIDNGNTMAAFVPVARRAVEKLRALQGFTPEDVRALRGVAEWLDENHYQLEGHAGWWSEGLASAADRIAALLPPSPETPE